MFNCGDKKSKHQIKSKKQKQKQKQNEPDVAKRNKKVLNNPIKTTKLTTKC